MALVLALNDSNDTLHGVATLRPSRGEIHGSVRGVDTVCLTWQQCGLLAAFLLLIVVTLIGNTLVILAVLTTRRLRTVTNCFVMSLALADWLVGTFVMPPAVSLFVTGKFIHHIDDDDVTDDEWKRFN